MSMIYLNERSKVSILYQYEREKMCELTKIMFEKNLLDTTGGNLSKKIDENLFLITPSLASRNKFFNLEPSDILIIDNTGKVIDGNGTASREINMHLLAYQSDKRIGTIIHSHANNSLIYASKYDSMNLILENVWKLKEVKVLDFAKAGTMQLAENVANFVKSKKCDKLPMVALLKYHGIVVAGNDDMNETLEMLERIEKNAFIGVSNIERKDFSI